jgi:hypothetical protein
MSPEAQIALLESKIRKANADTVRIDRLLAREDKARDAGHDGGVRMIQAKLRKLARSIQ